MKKADVSGRPPLWRGEAAGRNLGLALKLLGKTWRRDQANPNHVCHWECWADAGLPNSATTIDRDIREGVPVSRIAAYAGCLGLTPEALASPETDVVAALGAPPVPRGGGCPPSPVLRETSERYLDYNRDAYLRELFGLVGGVYRMHYVLEGVEAVYRCALWIHTVEAHGLRTRGHFMMFGNENPFDTIFFRWHNNLHAHFLCENGLELGYAMFIDPVRHNLVRRRDPFWLRGRGMTDRGLADNVPITLALRMEKLPQPDGGTCDDLYAREYADMRQRPFLAPEDPDYAAIRADILAPDELM